MIDFFTRTTRRFLVGKDQEFVFKAATDTLDIDFQDKKGGLYLHIPFCKSLCPFCPYNRIRYEREQAELYLAAVLCEIDLYWKRLGSLEITSIYIGGGTPTNMIDELGVMLARIQQRFTVTGSICIETGVSDINIYTVKKL